MSDSHKNILYRMISSKVYHLPGDDYLWNGKAKCGADIGRPSHYTHLNEPVPFGKSICKKCNRATKDKNV